MSDSVVELVNVMWAGAVSGGGFSSGWMQLASRAGVGWSLGSLLVILVLRRTIVVLL